MVFKTTNLFKGIPCPEGAKCALTNCIFSHDAKPETPKTADDAEPPLKRRKLTYNDEAEKPPSKADQIHEQLAARRNGHVNTAQGKTSEPKHANANLSSLSKPVSPPSTNGANGANTRPVQPKSTFNPQESLNPRMIPNDPAGHAKRSLYLKHLHGEMARLNQKLSESAHVQHKDLLCLTEQELVKMALDEEERIARDQPLVYANIIKQRLVTYKKMDVQDWAKQVRVSFEKDKPHPPNKQPKSIETGLTPEEEVLILPHLVADQSTLSAHGYIPVPPTTEQAAEAAAAVELSKNYEVCDRCGARFQVFPHRNEEGLLASNGPCKHHPNRKVFPSRTKGDAQHGHREPYHPCCNNAVGSPGCTENEYHVFKSSSAGRLSAVLPFTTTPGNEHPAKDRHGREVKAVTFDCEMGYTAYGLELIRLTAVAWPSNEMLLDVLVRPLGEVIDLNSRFSGVFPEHFRDAIPYDQHPASRPSSASPTTSTHTNASTTVLPIVPSPDSARTLLCSLLTPTTPLLGHAIDNDLNAVRLCHPTVIDTVLLFPHQRGALPWRMGLKALTGKYLGRAIQMGGERGHDSAEDARATGDLVRVKVGEMWRGLKGRGWRMQGGGLVKPEKEASTEDVVATNAAVAGSKRKRSADGDGGEDRAGDAEARQAP